MRLRMWTYDLAREQAPDLDQLRSFLDLTREAGYTAIGIYMEHRFAYPSAPWSHGKGAVTPEMIRQIQSEYADIQIIPFLNLLGHFEGMLYTEEGRAYAEEKFKGMQACPSNPAFVELAERLTDDILGVFESEIVHIGGDETWQLGCCDTCKRRVQEYEASPRVDGKAKLYGEHFGPLARRVADKGRTPAVWGDMFADHPQALDCLPKNTLIFDWQYFHGPEATTRGFKEKGFEVVCCPAFHTYNATWMHLPQTERNILDHVNAAARTGALGVCVTTWECGLFGNYETLLPALRAAGKMLQEGSSESGSRDLDMEEMRALRESPAMLAAYLRDSERYEEWARLMGVELQNAGGTFSFGGIRSSLKCRLLLYSNPFLAWLHHADELMGEVGNKAMEVFEAAIGVAPNVAARGVAEFGKSAIEFVRHAEMAHRAYARRRPGEAVTELSVCRQVFDNLSRIATATNQRIGGSLADIERCRAAKEHVEKVIRRVTQYGDGSLGYLPSFEMLTHPKFVPHDQAGWWLINRWANE